MKCNFTGQRLPVPHDNFIASLFKGAGLVSIRDAQLFILQVMKTFYQPVSMLRAAIGLYKPLKRNIKKQLFYTSVLRIKKLFLSLTHSLTHTLTQFKLTCAALR